MKKSLIALAAVAVSGLAMAQSSVTLYGVADVALGDANDVTGAHANSRINNGNSRIGFRGVEDLGNGLKASFQFEQAVSLADGSSPGFQRQAWVGLSGGFGALRAGRQNTPTYAAYSAFDIVGTANYSLNDRIFGFGGGSRDNSLFKYISPSFGGFQAVAGYVFEDNYSAGNKNGHYDLALTYKNGPLAAAVGYNKVKLDTGKRKRSSLENGVLGASYDLGPAKIAASYSKAESAGIKGGTLGVSFPIGAFSLAADVGYAQSIKNSDIDGVDLVIEAKYALSKRTFVYGAYYRADEDGPAFGKNFTKENNYGIGLRHNF